MFTTVADMSFFTIFIFMSLQVLTWNNCTFFSLEARALISFWSSIVDVFTVLLSLRPLWFAVDISLSSFFYYLSSWLRALTEPRSAFSLMALISELMSILMPVCWPCRVFERLRTSVPLQNISQECNEFFCFLYLCCGCGRCACYRFQIFYFALFFSLCFDTCGRGCL